MIWCSNCKYLKVKSFYEIECLKNQTIFYSEYSPECKEYAPIEGVKSMSEIKLCNTVGAASIPNEHVAHQSHYEEQGEQPIEYMEKSMPRDQFIGFLKGNIIKYVSRFEKKDGVRDLEKAKVYITWLIEYIKDGKIKVRE